MHLQYIMCIAEDGAFNINLTRRNLHTINGSTIQNTKCKRNKFLIYNDFVTTNKTCVTLNVL